MWYKKPVKDKGALYVGLAILGFILIGVISGENDTNNYSSSSNDIPAHFSSWDGSHNQVTRAIKSSMNDPKSYEHVETRYKVLGDNKTTVLTKFRGKNAFGGTVTQQAIAVTNTASGEVLELAIE